MTISQNLIIPIILLGFARIITFLFLKLSLGFELRSDGNLLKILDCEMANFVHVKRG